MDQYLLTQEDIDRLGITGVMAGEPATIEEMKLLDVPVGPSQQPAIQPDVPVNQQTTGTTQPATNTGIESLLTSVATQTAKPEDPYSNLTKTQKRMLAFAAISDAGMALQGKEGSSVRDLMSDLTKRADMKRKADAMRARQEMLGNFFGSGLSGGMSREAIITAMAQGLIDGPTGTAMLNEVERKEGIASDIAGKEMMIGQIDALLFDPALPKALGIEGFLRTPFAELGLDEDTARVKGRIDQIKGGAFLEAYKSLRGGGQITELEGQKAEAAQARFSTAQSEEDFRDALMEYKFYIEQGIRRLNGEQIPPDTLYKSEDAQSDPLNIR